MKVVIFLMLMHLVGGCGKIEVVDAPERLADNNALEDDFQIDVSGLALQDQCSDPVTAASNDAFRCAGQALRDAASLLNPAETATKISKALNWYKQATEALKYLKPILERLSQAGTAKVGITAPERTSAKDCLTNLGGQYQGSFKAADALAALDQAQQAGDPVKAAAALVTLSRFALGLVSSTYGPCVELLTPDLQKKLKDIFGDAVKQLGVISTLMQCGVAITNGTYVLVGQTRLLISDVENYYSSEDALNRQRQACLAREVNTETGCAINFGIAVSKAAGGSGSRCSEYCATIAGLRISKSSASAPIVFGKNSVKACQQAWRPGKNCSGPAVDLCISMCCNQNGGCVNAAHKQPTIAKCPSLCSPGSVLFSDCTASIANSSDSSEVKICNNAGNEYRSLGCEVNSCKQGFKRSNNSCVNTQICTPNQHVGTQPCQTTNSTSANQSKTCNASGTGYDLGTCTASTCVSGFTLSNGTCVAQFCTPNQPSVSQSCTVTNGSGSQTKKCNAQRTGFDLGPCIASQCNSGFTLSNGTCVAQICTPNQPSVSQSCTVTNGSGSQTKKCNAQRTGFELGPCIASQCNAGFTLSNGTCSVLNGKSCTPCAKGYIFAWQFQNYPSQAACEAPGAPRWCCACVTND